jgi:DUF971 family protein
MGAYKPNVYVQKAADELLIAIEKKQSSQMDLKDAGFRDGRVVLVFSDGRELSAKAWDLRAQCACALCLSEVTGKSLVDIKKIPADINPEEILPLGNYAVGITWSDGHASGIYPYSMFS